MQAQNTDERVPIGMVLAEVRDCGPVTVAQIREGLGTERGFSLSESTIRRLLVQLEEADLVESENYQRRARVYWPVERA